MNQCLERARKGDRQSTQAMVDSLRPRIAKMATYYARRTGEDPDDLLQEAWLGMLKVLPDLDMRIGSPVQYLIKHARWSVLDAIKYARVRRCSSLDDEEFEPSSQSSECAAASALVREFAERLTDKQRNILQCLLQGYTWREVGDVLGCTSANIAYYVRQIRQEYEEWAEEEESRVIAPAA